MAYRLLAQLVTTGAIALGRAVVQAWRETAARNAAESINAAGGRLCPQLRENRVYGCVCGSLAPAAVRVSASEARKILNVSDKPSVEEVEKAFEHIFEANSAERGNSFYLQSKAVRAREALMAELKPNDRPGDDLDPPDAVSSKN